MTLENRIQVNEPLLDGNEAKYLAECIETGWISSEGPFVTRFETEFAKRVGRTFGIAVCNGSAAIDAAIASLRIAPGDEVILPTFTIISCITQIVRSGATPVLVDCDPSTWVMRPEDVERAITKRTRAIMAVHIYGIPVDMDPLLAIAEKHGLRVIEDAAEMHGQLYKGKPCGSFGDISTFSFYANKHITTGEGGMIVTDDSELADRCRSLRNLCFRKEQRFVHDELGWNFRMTNIQAAIGVAQLERLDEFVARKRAIGAQYRMLLRDLPGITMQAATTGYAENSYWVFGVVLDAKRELAAADAMKKLSVLGIDSRPFFWPMHEQPVFRSMGLFEGNSFPVAEQLARFGFYLPSGMALTTQQIERSAAALKQILE